MVDIQFAQFISKNWGYEKIIVNGPLYCSKILRFVKGRQCSLHFHRTKQETFYLLTGRLEIVYMDNNEKAETILKEEGPESLLEQCDRKIMTPGDYFHLNPGLVHRMIGLEDSDLLEVSTTDRPEDSYRLIKGD